MADPEGVNVYLLLLEPGSLVVKWANSMVDDLVRQRAGRSAAGLHLAEVIPYADELGLPRQLREVAENGEPKHSRTFGFSPSGNSTRTDASMYRLPDGDLLVASQYMETPRKP